MTWGIPYQIFNYHDILAVVGEYPSTMLGRACSDRCSAGIMQTVSQIPEPVFQKVVLTDLPNDLLCGIFEMLDKKEVALLSATCKRMATIGLVYRFKVRFPCAVRKHR
jgi:hypothetical protein